MTRVLLVDDHRMFAELVADRLRREDDMAVTAIATSGDAAVEAVRSDPPDVAVLDYLLPGEDGVAIARRIREVAPEHGLLMLTGVDADDVLRAALLAGCTGFVTKDRALDELVDAVRAVVAGRGAVDPRPTRRLASPPVTARRARAGSRNASSRSWRSWPKASPPARSRIGCSSASTPPGTTCSASSRSSARTRASRPWRSPGAPACSITSQPAEPAAACPRRGGHDGAVTVDDLALALADIVGAEHVLSEPELRAGYETDWTGRFTGVAACVVRPQSTTEVAAVLRACAAARAAVVPQGGNTGLVGGGVPRGGEVVLSTRRLDDVGPVDADHGEVVVGAGAPLDAVRHAARAAGWDVGVDLAARDSATVGGMVATNAGGEHVLRYGRMRNQVLGVEAVLADGSVVGRVPALRKDATGIEWAGVLSGSEGILAVITRVHLALVPDLPDRAVALVALDDFAAAVRVGGTLQSHVGSLLALEVFFADGLARVCAQADLPAPFAEQWPVYLLVEVAGRAGAEPGVERLARAFDRDEAIRASAVATDPGARARLWEYRDRHAEAVNAAGVPHKLDVTLPHDRLTEFVARVEPTITACAPRADLVLFGHLGDGNLHVNVLGLDRDDNTVDRAVLELVARLGGSISAEHGIGVAKRDDLALSRTASDIDAMRAVKRALDPLGILNPGVLLPDPRPARRRRSGSLDGHGDVAQLARAPALQAGGRGFESHRLHGRDATREPVATVDRHGAPGPASRMTRRVIRRMTRGRLGQVGPSADASC